MKSLNVYLNGYQPAWSYRFFRPFRVCGELYQYFDENYPGTRYICCGLDSRLDFPDDDTWRRFCQEWIAPRDARNELTEGEKS